MKKTKKQNEIKHGKFPKDKHMETENTLPAAKMFAKNLFNSMKDGFSVLNNQGVHLDVNPALCQMTGFSREELIGVGPPHPYWPKEEYKKIERTFQKVLKGEFSDIESIFMRKNGERFPVIISPSWIKDRRGNTISCFATMKDISELKKTQKREKRLATAAAAEKARREAIEDSMAALEEKTRKLTDSRTAMIHMLKSLDKKSHELADARDYNENIIKSMIDTLIVIDPDGKIRSINKAFSDLSGYTETELIGKPVATVFAEETPLSGTNLKTLIRKGPTRNYNITYKTKTGMKVPVSFSGSVMRQVSCPNHDKPIDDCPEFKKKGIHCEKTTGFIGIGHDMRELNRLMEKEKELATTAAAAAAEKKRATELEKAYKQLRETQEKLIQSEKMATVGRLAAGVAHEINNPMAAILLGAQRMADMIQKQTANIPGAKDYLKILARIERATNRSKSIVAGLLAFSQPTMLRIARTNINNIIEETLDSVEDLVKKGDVKVIKHFADHLPTREMDGQQLTQVFINLIMNACDAMSKGDKLLTIRTRLKKPRAGAVDKAGRKSSKIVEIEFSDTGQGMSEAEMLRIFDPFFTTKETGKGVGLGLAISYGIVKEHGGTIEVSSKKGKGSTFIVSLPVKNTD